MREHSKLESTGWTTYTRVDITSTYCSSNTWKTGRRRHSDTKLWCTHFPAKFCSHQRCYPRANVSPVGLAEAEWLSTPATPKDKRMQKAIELLIGRSVASDLSVSESGEPRRLRTSKLVCANHSKFCNCSLACIYRRICHRRFKIAHSSICG